jgi:hypothetical protein
MNLKTFAKAVRRSAGKNASKILGGLAITGSITAVYFAVTATPKAMILLDEKKQELGVEKLDVKTIVKTAGPVYVPTALSMVLSAGCVIGAVHVDERRNAALAAACTLSESALKTYQDKVLEAIGPRRNRRSGRLLRWKRWPSAPNRQPSSLPRALPRPMFPTTSG